MKKFWQLVSRKDLIFIICIFLLVIVISLVEPLTKITVTMDDSAVEAKSTRYFINVKYELIESAELVEMPDKGNVVNGSDDMSIRYGIWNNDTWGEYTIVAIPNATNCIVMHLHDGRTFVFNARSNEYTAELFAALSAHLNP